jgi:hypothetical protein
VPQCGRQEIALALKIRWVAHHDLKVRHRDPAFNLAIIRIRHNLVLFAEESLVRSVHP